MDGATGVARSARQCSIGHVRRLLALTAGALGLGALLRRRRAKARAQFEAGRPFETGPSPADELRARLAESRELAAERDEDEARETTVDAAPDPGPDARRREVHERARRTLDELQ
jgi:hypothetical protein